MRKTELNIMKEYYRLQKKVALLFKKEKLANNAQSQWKTTENQDCFTPENSPDYNKKLNQIRSELTPTKKQIEEQESLNNALFVSQVLRISVSAEVNDSENHNNKPKKRR